MHVNALVQLDMKTRKLMPRISESDAVQSIRPAQEGLSLFLKQASFGRCCQRVLHISDIERATISVQPSVADASWLLNLCQLLRPVARIADRCGQCSFIQSAVDVDNTCSQIARNRCIWVGRHNGLLDGSGTMAATHVRYAESEHRNLL